MNFERKLVGQHSIKLSEIYQYTIWGNDKDTIIFPTKLKTFYKFII